MADSIQQVLYHSQVFQYGGQWCRGQVWPWQPAASCSMPESLQQHQGLPPLQIQQVMTGENVWEHFSSPCGSNFTRSGRFQEGGRDWKAELRSSLCLVTLDFYASWGPSWFCFHWNCFLPPSFLCQNNVFLLSSSEFTTMIQKHPQKNFCGKIKWWRSFANFRIAKLKRKQSQS